MALGFRKIMIEIQGNLFDLWHLSSAEKEEEWNDKQLRMDYFIIINKSTVSGNYKEVKFTYDSKEKRDDELAMIQRVLKQSPFVLFANDVQEDEEIEFSKRKKKKPTETDDDEDLDLSDFDED